MFIFKPLFFNLDIVQTKPKTLVVKGKLNEIERYIKDHCIDMAIFDDDLTPSQLRNIEKKLACKILDRSNLIIDIFASRARTSHAKTQVELAQYQYLLPRLTRLWLHLSRLVGGIGTRGPGEKQLEVDKRQINKRIDHLKKKLKITAHMFSESAKKNIEKLNGECVLIDHNEPAK